MLFPVCSLPLRWGKEASSFCPQMRVCGGNKFYIETLRHPQTYTQESGEPGYCSALYEGLRVLA